MDIIGAILIFKFGLPEPIGKGGHTYFMVKTEDDKEEKRSKRYDFWAKAGMWFLILGFALQLIANYAPQVTVNIGGSNGEKPVAVEIKSAVKSVEKIQPKVVPNKP
jgi:hypothetical protein